MRARARSRGSRCSPLGYTSTTLPANVKTPSSRVSATVSAVCLAFDQPSPSSMSKAGLNRDGAYRAAPSPHGMSKKVSHKSATSPGGRDRPLVLAAGDGDGVGSGVGTGVASGCAVGSPMAVSVAAGRSVGMRYRTLARPDSHEHPCGDDAEESDRDQDGTRAPAAEAFVASGGMVDPRRRWPGSAVIADGYGGRTEVQEGPARLRPPSARHGRARESIRRSWGSPRPRR